MAERPEKLPPRRQDQVRQQIQASKIIARLTDCVMGKINLSPSQVAAARTLLAKTLPDLTSVELSGDVQHHYLARVPAVADTTEKWAAEHVPVTH